MLHYYEISYYDGNEFPVTRAFNDLDNAIEFANTNGINHISEIGGCWDDFHPCECCGEWFTYDELNNDLQCTRCDYNLNYR